MALRRDFEYWGLDELLIEPCCALKYYPEIEQVTILISQICALHQTNQAVKEQKG